MTMSSLPATIGTVNGSPIVADPSGVLQGAPATRVSVTLSADFNYAPPPGWPSLGDCGGATPSYPRVVRSGEVVTLLRCEGAALVAAGAAAYT